MNVHVCACACVREREPASEQRGWRLSGEAAEAEDLSFRVWGSAGECQDLREAYRYTHGRASEEYECYVIPEEEDEEEAADVFCVTCKTPIRALEKVLDEHREHEVTPLNKALESAKVNGSPWSSFLLLLHLHLKCVGREQTSSVFYKKEKRYGINVFL